jgi:NADH-quinone oxidoreductase subunit E
MREIAERLGIAPAEVLGTASFYTMFKREPIGRYLISVCRGISCMWLGSEELFAHLSDRLGVGNNQTTSDGMFTLEEMECAAACGGAPCVLVNYLFAERVTPDQADAMLEELRAGRQPSVLLGPIPTGSHPGPASLPPEASHSAPPGVRGV